jgi:hypothetical protein
MAWERCAVFDARSAGAARGRRPVGGTRRARPGQCGADERKWPRPRPGPPPGAMATWEPRVDPERPPAAAAYSHPLSRPTAGNDDTNAPELSSTSDLNVEHLCRAASLHRIADHGPLASSPRGGSCSAARRTPTAVSVIRRGLPADQVGASYYRSPDSPDSHATPEADHGRGDGETSLTSRGPLSLLLQDACG